MLTKNNEKITIGSHVRVYKYFNGIVEGFGKDRNKEKYAFISWEMKSGYKYGKFYSEEIILQ